MDQPQTPAESRELRVRKLRFRAWHRGLRELDLLLGRYADAAHDSMTEADFRAFEALLDVPDRLLLAWIVGEEPVPEASNSPLFRRLVAFHNGGGERR